MSTDSLQSIRIAGFRSLRDVTLRPSAVTVLIGPNGAGKSNILWALEMTRLLAHDSLQLFVGQRGGATFLMHYGPKQTAAIDLELEFTSDAGHNSYQARLGYAADESLIFLRERAGFRATADQSWRWVEFGAGHRETKLQEAAEKNAIAKKVRWLLRHINFYHFHDTSRRSALRTRSYADVSGNYLRSDGSNLPMFLKGLKESTETADQAAWRRIEGSIRVVAPFITRLEPKEDKQGVSLEWTDDQGAQFGPSHLSDGTLRALALITALAQPEEDLPLLSCIDEPELGLHPAAIELLCGLISSAATRRQIIVATQSPVLLDHFEAEQVVVAERHNGATSIRQLNGQELASWLEDYTLSQLYDKNVLGGRP